MDRSRFDGLARSLSNSRRSLLGGMLVAAGGWLGVARTEAKKKTEAQETETASETQCLWLPRG
jgi:hypothetical protein